VAEPLVLRPSDRRRALFIAVGTVGLVAGAALVASGSVRWAFLAICGLTVVLEGARARVAVDREQASVTSTRAFRRRVVAIADITGVRVPLWGPLALTLRQGTSKRARVVVTGLYAEHRGGDHIAADLATCLGVPVTSRRPAARS
jgi:hypothetical protein